MDYLPFTRPSIDEETIAGVTELVHAAIHSKHYDRRNIRHVVVEDGHDAARTRMGPLLEKGMITVDLINEVPKEQAPEKNTPGKKAAPIKEFFRFPTPGDLTAEDLAKGKPDKKPEAKEGRRKAQAREEARAPNAFRLYAQDRDQGDKH